jgi:hypothetical protein
MKTKLAIMTPLLLGVLIATTYTNSVLSTPKSKEAYIGTGLLMFGFHATCLAILLPALGCGIYTAWPQVNPTSRRYVLLLMGALFFIAVIMVPEAIIKSRWR